MQMCGSCGRVVKLALGILTERDLEFIWAILFLLSFVLIDATYVFFFENTRFKCFVTFPIFKSGALAIIVGLPGSYFVCFVFREQNGLVFLFVDWLSSHARVGEEGGRGAPNPRPFKS